MKISRPWEGRFLIRVVTIKSFFSLAPRLWENYRHPPFTSATVREVEGQDPVHLVKSWFAFILHRVVIHLQQLLTGYKSPAGRPQSRYSLSINNVKSPIVTFLPVFFLIIWELHARRVGGFNPRACRKLGLRNASNLIDQNCKKYNDDLEPGQDSFSHLRWTVKALFIYPIKSCAPIEVSCGKSISTGLKYDRQFSFAHCIEEENGVGPEQWRLSRRDNFKISPGQNRGVSPASSRLKIFFHWRAYPKPRITYRIFSVF